MKFLIKVLLVSCFVLTPLFLQALELHNLELVLEITEPDTTIPSSGFGIALTSGDVNGDGYSDIIVGRGEINYKYCVCVYYGGPVPDSIPDLIFMERPEDNGYAFGNPIEVIDVNGDGFDDVIVIGGKRTRVYFGGNPMDSLPDLIMKPGSGCYINGKCGDLNNDGYDDWVIPEFVWEGGRGKIDIYFGDSIPDTISDITLRGEEIDGGNFGGGIASGFDVNNDGYDDLFISAFWYGAYQGKTYIYYGGNPMDTIPDVEMLGKAPGDEFSGTIALLPDLNGDGYDDACVGDPLSVVHDTAYIYWGGNLMDSSADMIFAGDSGTRYGYAVAGVKDILPSGEKGLIVGACYYPYNFYNGKGKVYVYIGGDSIDTVVDAYAVGEDSLQQIGWSVADAGDINGDGVNEIMFSNCAAPSAINKVWVCKYTGQGVEENSNIKTQNPKLEISQNPFVHSTTLKYQLPSETKVSLKLYDISGRCVKTLIDGTKKQGVYKEELQAIGLSIGIYFIKFTAGNYKETKKIVMMR